jgi:putative membrane protein
MPHNPNTVVLRNPLPTACALAVGTALLISGLQPYSRLGWLAEASPVVVVGLLLVLSHRRFPLSALTYLLLSLFALVVLTGAAYSFQRVPLGFWLEDVFDLSRNPYDRLGHFLQGVVPAMVVRELLLRRGWVTHRLVAAVLSACVALALSAGYEILQWRLAVFFHRSMQDFMGMQGDLWDSQADMLMALLGAVLALALLSRLQDRQMAALPWVRPRRPAVPDPRHGHPA